MSVELKEKLTWSDNLIKLKFDDSLKKITCTTGIINATEKISKIFKINEKKINFKKLLLYLSGKNL